MNLPVDNQTIMPYLILKNAEGFSKFTQNVFGGIETGRHMRDEKTIMHAEIIIGGCTIMFAEATDQYKVQNTGLFIYVEDADAIYKKALDEGATSIMPPADQPYGRSSGVLDPFGNTWWITTPPKQQL